MKNNEYVPKSVTLLSTGKAAKYIGYAEITLRVWRAKKIGPKYRKINGKCFYNIRHLKQFIKGE